MRKMVFGFALSALLVLLTGVLDYGLTSDHAGEYTWFTDYGPHFMREFEQAPRYIVDGITYADMGDPQASCALKGFDLDPNCPCKYRGGTMRHDNRNLIVATPNLRQPRYEIVRYSWAASSTLSPQGRRTCQSTGSPITPLDNTSARTSARRRRGRSTQWRRTLATRITRMHVRLPASGMT